MHNVNDWVKIIDISSNEILVAGQVSKRKENYEMIEDDKKIPHQFSCISFDDRWFFSETTNANHFSIEPNEEHLIKPLNINSMPSYYKIVHSNYAFENADADIFREQNLQELDEEIKGLVESLNLFDGAVTTSSCCGHGISPAWVDIQFNDIKFLGLLIKILNKESYRYNFVLRTDTGIQNSYYQKPILKLITVNKGKEAYKIIDKLSKELTILSRNM